MYTDSTTTIFPRFPDTLPYVYTRGHSTQRFPTLPSPSFYPKHTARMSVIPVLEPGLAERARISTINLDNYQGDPESPPLSPLSSHQIAAYQKMISKTDFTQQKRTLATVPPYGTMVGENPMTIAATSRGETVLTVCMNAFEDQLHTILEDIHSYPTTCLKELEFFMTKWDVKPRVRVDTLEDPVDKMIAQFRQVCGHAVFRARDAQEKAQEKRLEVFENVVQQIRCNSY
ncbi:hypothetical protein Tco_1442640 [Tanacetum coccineum]